MAVTVDMLRDIHANGGLDFENPDDALLFLALVTAFSFLLRSGEYLSKGGASGVNWRTILRVSGVYAALDGDEVTDWDIAEEMMLLVPGLKTDQSNRGDLLNYFATDDALCPMRWIRRLLRLRPGFFAHSERAFFTYVSGVVIPRAHLEKLLRASAVRLGVPPSDLGLHSLRAGGASAMYHAGFTPEEIKRRGRWASDCWRIYIWESREKAKNIGARIFGQSYSLMASASHFARHMRR
jgi:hypothetical protein